MAWPSPAWCCFTWSGMDLEFAGFVSAIAPHPAWLMFGHLLVGGFMGTGQQLREAG
ncbi:hypothetical protein [Sinorhizobium alkalisoli]|uniref:hypothetical protein n=1 Tax=Sinorhizobium alkalisoli TaxID=1752398 RepID=UPI00178C7109|nr:hypothetical protein [Sinorhizobium alkalisoli]